MQRSFRVSRNIHIGKVPHDSFPPVVGAAARRGTNAYQVIRAVLDEENIHVPG
jgi:hypothetical protein